MVHSYRQVSTVNANLTKILDLYSDESYYTTFSNKTDIKRPKRNPFSNPFGGDSNKHAQTKQIQNNNRDSQNSVEYSDLRSNKEGREQSTDIESSLLTPSSNNEHRTADKRDNYENNAFYEQQAKDKEHDGFRIKGEINKQRLFARNEKAANLKSFHALPEIIAYTTLTNL